MKKLFLLMAAGLMVTAANAQENSSIIIRNAHLPVYSPKKAAPLTQAMVHPHSSATNTAGKTTGPGSAGTWFSFEDALTVQSVSQNYLWWIYQDSTVIVSTADGATTPFNWYIDGFGTSFDPTSTAFGSQFANTTPMWPQATFGVTNADAYTVDSIFTTGLYTRRSYNPNVTDTLFIEITQSGATGAGKDTFHAANNDFVGINNEGTVAWAYPGYDTFNTITNKVPSAEKITILMDAAFYANDSAADGSYPINMALPTPLNVPAGEKVIVFSHFASGTHFHFGYDIDSANIWQQVCSDLTGGNGPQQFYTNPLDYNAGIIANTQDRYELMDNTTTPPTPEYSEEGGVHVLGSTYFYGTQSTGFENPFYAFYLTCNTCAILGVTNTAKTITSSAYPNPAIGEVNIPFTLTQVGDVTITLTNTMGQAVTAQTFKQVNNGKAVFNTSVLADGVYFYIVKANGQQTTGHIVVAH